jgi:hypothetical protein
VKPEAVDGFGLDVRFRSGLLAGLPPAWDGLTGSDPNPTWGARCPYLEMATGTRNPSTRRVLPDKEAGME